MVYDPYRCVLDGLTKTLHNDTAVAVATSIVHDRSGFGRCEAAHRMGKAKIPTAQHECHPIMP